MLVLMSCVMLVPTPILGIGGVVFAVHEDPGLAWVIAVAVPIMLAAVLLVTSRMRPHFQRLQALQVVLEGHAGASMRGSSFHDAISELYGKGVEWAVGVDLEALIKADNPPDMATLEALGLLDVQHIIGERRQIDGLLTIRASAAFSLPLTSINGLSKRFHGPAG